MDKTSMQILNRFLFFFMTVGFELDIELYSKVVEVTLSMDLGNFRIYASVMFEL